MNIIKTAVWAAAAYGTYRLLTDRNLLTGKTLIETLGDEATAFLDKLSAIKEDVLEQVEEIKEEVSSLTGTTKSNEPLTKAPVDPTLGDVMV